MQWGAPLLQLWFALAVPSGCSGGRYPAVATHEFGHVFGPAHVSESNHPSLTMGTATSNCTNAALTLGLGDVRALRQLYGDVQFGTMVA